MPPSGSPPRTTAATAATTSEWSPPRVGRDGPLIFSIHVPKTAGSRFGRILKARYGSAFALYYGPHDPRTHPLIRVPAHEWTADHLDRLHAAGVRILHGHYFARSAWRHVPDPSRYWFWLREPIEHTISYWHYVRSYPRVGAPFFERVKAEGTSLEEFAKLREVSNAQSQHVRPLPLAEAGFVGVTELFAPMLPLLGLSDRSVASNVNAGKPLADRATREALVPLLQKDLALYSEAMELGVRRLGVRDRGRAGLLGRARTIVAGWRPGAGGRPARAAEDRR
jgi:hypothetical protein